MIVAMVIAGIGSFPAVLGGLVRAWSTSAWTLRHAGYPRGFHVADDLIGDQDVRNADIDEHFCFAGFLAADAARAGMSMAFVGTTERLAIQN